MQNFFSLIFLSIIFSVYPDEIHNVAYQPWYTGSLISFDGENTPKNATSLQPYLLVTTNYGLYNNNFSRQSVPKEVVITPLNVLYYGFTNFWDMELTLFTNSSFRQSASATRFGDISLLFGFQLMRETKERPFVRLLLQETFPVGKYNNSNPAKKTTDLSGMGTFLTCVGFATTKTHNWFYRHPICLTWNFLLEVPSKVAVRGINFYGGAPDTDGTVRQGVSLFFLLSPEISLTQRWVITTDIIYIKQLNGSFSGKKGTNPDGSEALIMTQQEDSFQLSPSIEYNFSEQFGVLAGVWFSVFGRNNLAFTSGVVSAIITF